MYWSRFKALLLRLPITPKRIVHPYTLAHELGHLMLSVTDAKVDDEKAAHRFAGVFLMPAAALWAEIGRRRTSVGWGELFELK